MCARPLRAADGTSTELNFNLAAPSRRSRLRDVCVSGRVGTGRVCVSPSRGSEPGYAKAKLAPAIKAPALVGCWLRRAATRHAAAATRHAAAATRRERW
eukprot:6202916-Pleurochrysis_carterae.AAC.1